MAFDNYMTRDEVYRSVRLGQELAFHILNSKRKPRKQPIYNSALRHELATNGTSAAIALAQRLCGMTAAEATEHVAMLKRTRSHDIVSPHWM